MMQQYIDMKNQYKDCILFYRIGDFYEMFFEDAQIASRELEITLTGRDCGMDERAPMCGVPFHAAETYIARLVNKGYKVAICEQLEDPALAKGLVKRDVIRIVTPGTVTEASMLDDKKNNYLMCIYKESVYFGISVVDISTGEFLSTEISFGNTVNKLIDEIAKFSPSEIVINRKFLDEDGKLAGDIAKKFNAYITPFDNEYFEERAAMDKLLEKFNDKAMLKECTSLQICASGALLSYAEQTQKADLSHIEGLESYKVDEYMILDAATRRNLELCETMREKERKGSLLWVLDRTMTSMGARTLRKWIEQPLVNVSDIHMRQEAVGELKEKFMLRSEIRELLKGVYDIERLISRIVIGNVNCRDLLSLKASIGQIPYIKELLKNCESEQNIRLLNGLDNLDDIYSLIDSAIIDDPPVSVKEGGIIKEGYNAEVDKLRRASTDGKKWIAELEASEREKTGIKNLKVGFNKVFGYYLEVTKSYFNLVPENYIRKQTLSNCERYVTQELKEIEDTILGAEEKVIDLEYKIFCDVRSSIASQVNRIKRTAGCIAEIDVLCSLAEVADRENYCMPEVNNGDKIEVTDGRHPVVEKMLDEGSFVPNDVLLDTDENRIAVITGPNMAGKSTYMRQTALIVLMAQIGSFVPASKAVIGIADRIFTRVGASDDLASGHSTFMVEMTEVANILNNATKRSLIILDEIGRGTSTFDGLSIAWSVIEFISDKQKIGARTLFATHYHELTELENKIPGVKNYCVLVKEKGEDIIFLRKIIRGKADESYGVEVARLAGVPKPVITRAREILEHIESGNVALKQPKQNKHKKNSEGQIDLFALNSNMKAKDEVANEIMNLDVTTLTPLDAINILYKLQQKIKLG